MKKYFSIEETEASIFIELSKYPNYKESYISIVALNLLLNLIEAKKIIMLNTNKPKKQYKELERDLLILQECNDFDVVRYSNKKDCLLELSISTKKIKASLLHK